LYGTEACVERVAKHRDLGRFFFGVGLADMKLVVDTQHTLAHRSCDRFGTHANFCNQGF
jgi:hypothetical protein